MPAAQIALERRAPRPGPRKAKRLPDVLSAQEVRALMAAPNQHVPTGFRDRVLMQLMHRCGLRISEACGIRLGDVDWETGHIRLIAEHAKGSKERTAYADPVTLEMLLRWREVRGRYTRTRTDQAPLFISVRSATRGRAVTTDSIYKSIRRRMLKAGIASEKAHPHTLRHTFATDALGHGVSIVKLQRLLGHASIETTSIYLHVNDPELAVEVQAIEWGY